MPEPEAELVELAQDQAFAFACGPGVPCFNACCRDLNQFLTPYDILRLKNALGLSSERFLEDYTRAHTGPSTGLPVRTLVSRGPERECVFLTPEGCRVYGDRPSSCRTYPLVRMASRNRATGETSERWFLLQEAHCRGFGGEALHTPAQWAADQGLATYNRRNDRFMEVIAAKNQEAPGPLSGEKEQDFVLACYDLDRFADLLARGGLHRAETLASDLPAPGDEEGMLDLALRWIIQRIASPF
ncbi:MAG: YkgJ family cysteine cluster protein [Proteobacteria bacterium]|nr:YkgJ family cysteine cluster protein [Pseudomonadota bacterium]